jgi:arylsulfatase A-like enzyme
MIHPAILVALCLLLAACAAPRPRDGSLSEVERPNVIVILADDLGYGDLGAYGGTIPTPNIDALARSGVRFTDGYVTAAVCAPSRSALLSGRHQARFGFEFNPVGRDEQRGLPTNETTIAQVMKQAGYATGMIGKWHIGQAQGFHPLDRGFDSYFGVLGGATTYLSNLEPGDLAPETGLDKAITRARLPIYRGRTVVDPPGYLTDVFTDEATAFIRENAGHPFFLYLAYNAPHTPLQATKAYLDRFPGEASPYRRTYEAMVSALDDGVGRVMAQLRASGLDRRTVVIFLSDNGCPNYVMGACSNAPLAGFKAFPWEGGVRTPFIISAPGRLPAGRVEKRMISSLDLMPTLADLAGVRPPAQAEGTDLMPYLTGRRSGQLHDILFWRMGPNHAVREGRWKLLVVNKADSVQSMDEVLGAPVPDGVKAEVSPLGQWVLLFDLEADPGERRDLAALHPEIVRRLQARFAEWDRSNVEPMFTSRRQFKSQVDGRKVQLFN